MTIRPGRDEIGERNAHHRPPAAAQRDGEDGEIQQGRDRRRPDGLHLDLEEPPHLLDIEGLEASPIDALEHRLARCVAHPIVAWSLGRSRAEAPIGWRPARQVMEREIEAMSWTEERIERLKKMWHDGATASQIADELGGVSRNAVIGKAHRLGLEQRPSPVKPGEEKEAKKAAPRRAPPPKPAPKAEAPQADAAAAAAAALRHAPASPPRRSRSAPGNAISLDRPRRLHPPGPGRPAGADPARAAAPPGPGQAEPRGRRQDQPARSQRPHLQMADGPSRASPTSISAGSRPTPASLIASSIAASPIRRSSRAATAARRRRCRSAGRGCARAL